jgi:hypothetical protein
MTSRLLIILVTLTPQVKPTTKDVLMGMFFGNSMWVILAVLIWGPVLAWDAFDVFDAKVFFGQGWEKRQLEKPLGRKVD